MKKDFNIILSGVGGQGIITLVRILAAASLIEKRDIKTSELHGLSQRGGSVNAHVRFGKEIYSPLVRQGEANLIISLEAQEALKVCYFGSKNQTIFLVNDFVKPILGVKQTPSVQKIGKELKKFSTEVILIPANQICQKELGTSVIAGVFLLGYANYKNLIPLKQTSLSGAIKKVLPKKYLDLNLKTLALAKEWVGKTKKFY